MNCVHRDLEWKLEESARKQVSLQNAEVEAARRESNDLRRHVKELEWEMEQKVKAHNLDEQKSRDTISDKEHKIQELEWRVKEHEATTTSIGKVQSQLDLKDKMLAERDTTIRNIEVKVSNFTRDMQEQQRIMLEKEKEVQQLQRAALEQQYQVAQSEQQCEDLLREMSRLEGSTHSDQNFASGVGAESAQLQRLCVQLQSAVEEKQNIVEALQKEGIQQKQNANEAQQSIAHLQSRCEQQSREVRMAEQRYDQAKNTIEDLRMDLKRSDQHRREIQDIIKRACASHELQLSSLQQQHAQELKRLQQLQAVEARGVRNEDATAVSSSLKALAVEFRRNIESSQQLLLRNNSEQQDAASVQAAWDADKRQLMEREQSLREKLQEAKMRAELLATRLSALEVEKAEQSRRMQQERSQLTALQARLDSREQAIKDTNDTARKQVLADRAEVARQRDMLVQRERALEDKKRNDRAELGAKFKELEVCGRLAHATYTLPCTCCIALTD